MSAFRWRAGASPLDLWVALQRRGAAPSTAVTSAACLELKAREVESDARAIAAQASPEFLDRLAARASGYRLEASELLASAPELQNPAQSHGRAA